MKRQKSYSGFTIVELLVVIVIISILAAIIIVAFSGIQNRAKQAKIESASGVIRKTLIMDKSDNDSYYDTGSSGVCIGTLDMYPATNGYAAGACTKGPAGDLLNNVSSSFNTMLTKYISNTPDGRIDDTILYAPLGRGSRGIQYYYYKAALNARPYLAYYLSGRMNCGPQYQGTYNSTNNYTQCLEYLDSN